MYMNKTIFSLLVLLVCSPTWAQNAPRQVRSYEDIRQMDRENKELWQNSVEQMEKAQREAAAKKAERQRQETVRTTGCDPRVQRCDPVPAQRSVRQAPAQQAPAPANDPNATPSDQIKFRRTN